MELEILYEDQQLIAINKPHGLLVHRTQIATDARTFAVQLLRNQIGGQHVYPVHRLDRKTAGILLFAKTKEANQDVQKLFRKRQVEKTYVALVRGFVDESGQIDYALKHNEKTQEATTNYKLIHHLELDLPFGKFETSRYSLVELKPETGRFHQLRKHMAHILHPIIGDRPHGCNKQNKLWKERFNINTMCLCANSLRFTYPNDHLITISAPYSYELQRVLALCKDLAI